MAPVRRAGTLQLYSTNSGGITVTIPGTAAAGDVAIISVHSSRTANTPGVISGWTRILLSGSYSINLAIYWKVLSAGDVGSTVSLYPVSDNVTGYTIAASVEVWGGVKTPIVSGTAASAGVWPSVAASVGSIPLYIGAAYDSAATAPASVTPPGGLAGSYIKGTNPTYGLGAWFGNPTTGSSAPSVTFGLTGGTALLATLALPPSQTQNVVLAGATSAQDIFLTPILAGASAAQDINLVWTP